MNEVNNAYGYTSKMLEHVFWGEIHSDGFPSGFHCNRNLGDEWVEIEESTRAIIFGSVYEAQVKSKIDGKLKKFHDGYSTFFPDGFTRQQILDCLNNANQIEDDLYSITLGTSDIYIMVHTDSNNNIVTFYPIDPSEV